MDIYAEIDQKRAERAARRQERLEREARRDRIMAPIVAVAEMIVLAIAMYLYLFAGALWASM